MLLIREIFAKTPDEEWNEEFKRISDELKKYQLQMNDYNTSTIYAADSFGTINRTFSTSLEFRVPIVRPIRLTDYNG